MSGKAPNFFILGAPKCGTTSLARWLEQHPQVFMSLIKEPHYYSTDLANRAVRDSSSYKKLFTGGLETQRAIGEASTWYLFSKEAVSSIEREYVDPHYIVMSRDPVEMFRSLHHHNLRVLHENEPNPERAWHLQQERSKGLKIPKNCTEPLFLQYKKACSLGSQLERLYELVPRERILHITLEEMRTNPRQQYLAALSFFGVEDDGRTDFRAENQARGHRSASLQRLIKWGGRAKRSLGIQRGFGLAKLNDRASAKPELAAEFRQYLDSEFADERRKLDALITAQRNARSSDADESAKAVQ